MRNNCPESTDQIVTTGFAHVVKMIRSAQQSSALAVNAHLIGLYWQVGAFISQKLALAEWGDSVVEQLAAHIASTQPGLRGVHSSKFIPHAPIL